MFFKILCHQSPSETRAAEDHDHRILFYSFFFFVSFFLGGETGVIEREREREMGAKVSKRSTILHCLIAGLYWYVRSRSKMKLTYFESSRNRKIEVRFPKLRIVFANGLARDGRVANHHDNVVTNTEIETRSGESTSQIDGTKINLCARIIPEGLVSVDWIESTKSNQKDAVIVVVPGLTGSSQSGYIRRLAEHLVKESECSSCDVQSSRTWAETHSLRLSCTLQDTPLLIFEEQFNTSNNTRLCRFSASDTPWEATYLRKYLGERVSHV